MLGAIVGDVIGSRFEFNNTRNYHFKLFADECSFTDDTICTVAIMDAIVSGKSYQEKILEWCRQFPNPMGGYGVSFAQWLRSENPQPYNSFGNGAAMRVSPVAWAWNDLEDVKREAEKTASISHNHPEGILGAVAVAHAIWYFRDCECSQIYVEGKTSKPYASTKIVDREDFISTMNQYYPGFMAQEFKPGKFDETCQGTVPLCLQIIAHATCFEDAIRRAISWGGDSDTIGAIVGSIAEARWGIPDNIYSFALGYLHFDMLEVIKQFNELINL